MTKFETKDGTKYLAVCPRGFANEVHYLRVRPEQQAEVTKWLDGRKDREFNAGNTHWDSWWAEIKRAAPRAQPWEEATAVPAWAADL